jgi:hypothetical protein
LLLEDTPTAARRNDLAVEWMIGMEPQDVWDYDTHPAIADLPAKTRYALIASARRRLLARHRIWFHCLAISIVLLTASVMLYLNNWRGSHGLFWLAMAMFGVTTVGICSVSVRSRREFPHALQEEMMVRGIWPMACLFCGYTMRSIRGNDCPECGAKLSSRNSETPIEP